MLATLPHFLSVCVAFLNNYFPFNSSKIKFSFSGVNELFCHIASSFMVQKLFSFVDQTSVADNPDSLQNHEVLLPGHLITIYLKVEADFERNFST